MAEEAVLGLLASPSQQNSDSFSESKNYLVPSIFRRSFGPSLSYVFRKIPPVLPVLPAPPAPEPAYKPGWESSPNFYEAEHRDFCLRGKTTQGLSSYRTLHRLSRAWSSLAKSLCFRDEPFEYEVSWGSFSIFRKTGDRNICRSNEKERGKIIMLVRRMKEEEKEHIGQETLKMRHLGEYKEPKGRKVLIPRRQMEDHEAGIPAGAAAADSSFSFLMSFILAVSSAMLCLLPLLSTNKKFTESLITVRMLAGALMVAAITSLLALDTIPKRPIFAWCCGFLAILSSLFAVALFLPAFLLGAMFALI